MKPKEPVKLTVSIDRPKSWRESAAVYLTYALLVSVAVVVLWQLKMFLREIDALRAEKVRHAAEMAECRQVASDLGRALGQEDYEALVALHRQIREVRR